VLEDHNHWAASITVIDLGLREGDTRDIPVLSTADHHNGAGRSGGPTGSAVVTVVHDDAS
jgi:hypothetical protein